MPNPLSDQMRWSAKSMEWIFEVIFQLLGEILLQAFFEILVEIGLHSLAETVKTPKNPALSTIGFIMWGIIAGGVSLLIFPASPITNPDLRKLNLAITPLAIG